METLCRLAICACLLLAIYILAKIKTPYWTCLAFWLTALLVIVVLLVAVALCMIGMAAYFNGDRDGRIQQQRLDRDGWVKYMNARDEFYSCIAKQLYTHPPGTDLGWNKIISDACGRDPHPPEVEK